MQPATITAGGLFGYDGVVSEFGQPVVGVPLATPSAAPATAATGPVFSIPTSFWRSSDFGLILFGLGLLYFDMRLINR